MTISKVTPTKIYDEGILKAEFSITIDDCITINDIKVIQKDKDITVSLPRRRNEDGIYKEIVSPSNPEAKEIIKKTVLEAYETYLLLCKSFEA
ncbi:MAG: SpoVG family protein [Oscillospiraceae bacterium]